MLWLVSRASKDVDTGRLPFFWLHRIILHIQHGINGIIRGNPLRCKSDNNKNSKDQHAHDGRFAAQEAVPCDGPQAGGFKRKAFGVQFGNGLKLLTHG